MDIKKNELGVFCFLTFISALLFPCDGSQLKTFCHMNETLSCSAFSFSCNNRRVINVTDVWYRSNMSCDTNFCCCQSHINWTVNWSENHTQDIQGLCNGNASCDIENYLKNMTGKITVMYSCETSPEEDEPAANSTNSTEQTSTSQISPTIVTATHSSSIITETSSRLIVSSSLSTPADTTSNDGTTIVSDTSSSAGTPDTSKKTTSTEASANGNTNFPVLPVALGVPVGGVLIYVLAASIVICCHRRPKKKSKPSVVKRIVSKLMSPRNSRRLSDSFHDHDDIKRTLSMSDFSHVVTNMTYDDVDDHNIVTFFEDEIQRDMVHVAETDTAHSTKSTTMMAVNKLPGENYDVVVRFHKENFPPDSPYDHINHSDNPLSEGKYSTNGHVNAENKQIDPVVRVESNELKLKPVLNKANSEIPDIGENNDCDYTIPNELNGVAKNDVNKSSSDGMKVVNDVTKGFDDVTNTYDNVLNNGDQEEGKCATFSISSLNEYCDITFSPEVEGSHQSDDQHDYVYANVHKESNEA